MSDYDDEYVETELPDLTGLSLLDLLTMDSPEIQAAKERVVEQLLKDEPGCGC